MALDTAGAQDDGPGPRIGWDIGGANLKAARIEGGCLVGVAQEPCPLWQGLDRLHAAFDAVETRLGRAPRNLVTMTGELVDLFESRREGVAALAAAAADRLDGVLVYAGQLGFVAIEAVPGEADRIASANWHATAALAAARLGDGLVLDIGSTTTDVVPVAGGVVIARGLSDAERLSCGELVYTGATRTPLMAVASEVAVGGRRTALMAEHFATMADVNRILDRLPEGVDQHPTADGRGKTVAESRLRLSRMVGLDVADHDEAAWALVAEQIAEAQVRRIHDAALLVGSRGLVPRTAPVIGCGIGFSTAGEVARRLGRPLIAFSDLLPLSDGFSSAGAADWASGCAPAVAVALLSKPTVRIP